MKAFYFCLSFLLLFPLASMAQDKPAYRLFTGAGKPVTYAKMLQALAKAEVVFFGEQHDDPIGHWLQLQVLRDLQARHPNLVLALEMFEADDQLILDEYLVGTIQEKHLLQEAKLWPNYQTDYRPLVEFAKEKNLRVVATNIPRRYANLVYRQGLEALQGLPEEARQYLAPLPITVDLGLPGYHDMITSMGDHGPAGSVQNLARSQAVKDATMAHFLLQHLPSPVLHLNGTYHSKNQEGILWYVRQAQPHLSISTIHNVKQEALEKVAPAHLGTADFILVVPSDMVKTH